MERTESKSKSNGLSRQPALIVQNGCKQYFTKSGPTPILNDFCMTVERGTIYSLLGSSGCGKTTILSCCVGIKNLDKGDIFIFGARPGTRESGVPGKRVGYMPQEIALNSAFTITESLHYFGSIYGMTSGQIEGNLAFLANFLKLPDCSRLIKDLSGGQQRRVSFAVALIHNPELLILDEPTVGVDPLLRQSIWNHLCKLVATGKTTVIITTHYIEEARDSHRVGLMRNGRLLAEESPVRLLEEYKTNLLENIVLQLCLRDNGPTAVGSLNDVAKITFKAGTLRKQEDENQNVKERGPVFGLRYAQRTDAHEFSPDDIRWQTFYRPKLDPFDKSDCSGGTFNQIMESVSRLKALTYKNFLSISRNLLFLCFVLLLPTIQVTLICMAIGPDLKHLKVGFVNNDILAYENNCTLQRWSGCALTENFTESLSCRYLDLIDTERFDLISYPNETVARQDLHLTRITAYMVFPDNLTLYLKDRITMGFQVEPEIINGSKIHFVLDQANKHIGVELKRVIFKTFQAFVRNITSPCGIDAEAVDTPIVFEEPVYGTEDVTFTDFLAPSVLLGILFFFPVLTSAVGYIMEDKMGILDRGKVAGVTTFEILVSYTVINVILLIIQAAIAFALMILIFKIPLEGSVVLAFGISILVGIAGLSVGFLFSTFLRSELDAVLLAQGTFFPNFIVSGMIWPVEAMPTVLQYISFILPCTLACESLRTVLTRGAGILHPAVWPGILATLAWGLLYSTATILLHRRAARRK